MHGVEQVRGARPDGAQVAVPVGEPHVEDVAAVRSEAHRLGQAAVGPAVDDEAVAPELALGRGTRLRRHAERVVGGRPVARPTRTRDLRCCRCGQVEGVRLRRGGGTERAVLVGEGEVGGGVADAGELLLEPARRCFAEKLTGGTHRPIAEIRLAELGNEAGMVGAADLARAR